MSSVDPSGLAALVRPGAPGEAGFDLSVRPGLPALALAARGRGPSGAPGLEAWRAELAGKTATLTLLAGAGTRWVKSLASVRARTSGAEPAALSPAEREALAFDPEKPRGLFPVRDLLGAGRAFVPGAEPRVPMAAYALAAVKGLGSHLVVVRGHEAEIESEILSPLGFEPGSCRFFTQEAPFGKPLGHGDAAWQCRALWKGQEYVVANFGGDANSRLTILSALLALDALASRGEEVDLLVPAALVKAPGYPVLLDAEGLPRAFGHAKLQGAGAASGRRGEASWTPAPPRADGRAYTNVGLRVYRAAALLEAVERFRRDHWEEGKGYAIPGNDPEGREFALDNVDAAIAASGRARLFPVARPEELRPAKAFEDLPAFEAAVAVVAAEDRAAGL
ncbi:MAG TPA: hypothetical protein PLG14_07155 [Spirochaetales bacterium]|nr:hypothetical protein [Spirochaetales bacterium]